MNFIECVLSNAQARLDKWLIKLFKNRELLNLFKTLRIRPNTLTIFRMALAAPIFWLFRDGRIEAAGIVFFFATFLDLFDGPLARATGDESKIGAVLDPLADKILFACALWLLRPYIWGWLFWPLLVIETSLMFIRGLVALIYYIQKKTQPAMKANLFGKIKYPIQVIGGLLIFIHLTYHTPTVMIANLLLSITLFFSIMSVTGQSRKLSSKGSK